MTDRERRLRERIDRLADERDAALTKLADSRARNEKHRQRIRELEKSLALWRLRARQERQRSAKR